MNPKATDVVEFLVAAFTDGPLAGARWIYNAADDLHTTDPDVTWTARPAHECRTWPLPEIVIGQGGFYRRDVQIDLDATALTQPIRGNHYVWVGGDQ
jgi:hypothetical protein